MNAMSKVKLPGSNSMKVLALLMLCALWAMVGVFVTVNKQAELDQRRLASTGEQKVLSQRIAKYSLAASAGDYQALEALDLLHHFQRAGTRRVEQYTVIAASHPLGAGIRLRQVGRNHRKAVFARRGARRTDPCPDRGGSGQRDA